MIVQERLGKTILDNLCGRRRVSRFFPLARSYNFSFRFFPLPRTTRFFPRSSQSLPLAQSFPRLAPFFEYNLQTPLNARSRFKLPGIRRALLYPSVKISRSAKARAWVASVPPSRNYPFCTYPSKFWQPAACARGRPARLSSSCLVDPKDPPAIRLATLQKPRCNQTA